MILVGTGKVDLETEELNVVWATKPRKGVGISASVITNSSIRLGGTLSDPRITIRPLEALAVTGAAVATGGLSLLAHGLFDRVTAEKKVCREAQEDYEKRRAEQNR